MTETASPIAAGQYSQAIEALRSCGHELGLKASGGQHGHRQVWARDAMMALIGASLVDDRSIHAALLASLATLERHQSPAGVIPNYVDTETGKPNFRACSDSGLWFVVGSGVLRPAWGAMRRALAWAECQDTDCTGLIGIQEASDWQDLFSTRGKGLYVNCLHVMALARAAAVGEARGNRRAAALWRERAATARESINRYLWYGGDGQLTRQISFSFSNGNAEHDALGRQRRAPRKRLLTDAQYYLPWVGFRQAGEWFDSLGNLLAILSGVADTCQAARIFEFIARHGLDEFPMKAIYPAVRPGEPEWRDYYGTLNLPEHYHNGGIWPFIGGFYVAALVKTGRYEEAEAALERLSALNLRGGFNEWHHGQTGEPMGVCQQAWSAGMYIYACECVARRQAVFF